MANQQADLEWRDGDVPVSRQFDDPYYSLDNGIAETQHVFLAGNALPERFTDTFHIAELGFGTGLNFLVTLAAWRAAGVPGRLRFTSFEAFPMGWEDTLTALSAFNDLPVDALRPEGGLVKQRILGADFELEIIAGDARETVPDWAGKADAWFLDGFSPAKNPELWDPALMQSVAQHTQKGGTFATYTAAGFVRRGLAEAGFAVTRCPGFGRKRHMIRGHLL